jgi:hypothetical protein
MYSSFAKHLYYQPVIVLFKQALACIYVELFNSEIRINCRNNRNRVYLHLRNIVLIFPVKPHLESNLVSRSLLII